MAPRAARLAAVAGSLAGALAAAAPAVASPGAGAAIFGPAGVAASQGRPAGSASGAERLELSLLLRADDAGLTRYARAVSTPGSPLFGRYLDASTIERRFGPSRADRARVVGWLRARGLPARSAPGGFSVDTVVTVARARRLFSTRIAAFSSRDGGRFVAPVRAASLPGGLRGAVVGVNGLSNRPVASANSSSPAARAAQGLAPGARPLTPAQGRAFNTRNRRLGSSVRANLGTGAGCAAARSVGTPVNESESLYIPGYTPNQYVDAYGIDRLHRRGFRGQGQRVALIEIDGFARSDLTTAARCFGYRPPPTPVRTVGGLKQPLAPGAENTLDLQVLSAVAPSLKEIIVFQSTNTSYGTNKQYASAVALPRSRRPAVISSSIGGCEIGQSGQGPYVRQLERTLKQAAASGITVVVAAGDTGSSGCSADSNQAAIGILSVGFPASSPWVTGVGGTNFTLDTANRVTEEVVWNNAPVAFGAGNGGSSLMFRQPSWQRGPGIKRPTGSRWVPDVSLLADQVPGYAIYCTAKGECPGGWLTVGGTSAAAPLLGGILALANQQARKAGQPRLGHINLRIYRLAGRRGTREEVYRDVTRVGNDLGTLIGPKYLGDNKPLGCCTAGRYYDRASGWGSVRAPQFSRELRRLGN